MKAGNLSRLDRDHGAVVLVDLQEKLMPVIRERERVERQAINLVKAAKILGLPVVLTEQYPKGLGHTVQEVLAAAEGFPVFEKTTFSGCTADLSLHFVQSGIKSLLVAGVETHVCVTQTTLDALQHGYQVHVISEATSSRTEANRAIGLQRMHDAGAVISSMEMALFELLQEAGTPEFKAILQIIK